MQLMLQAAKSCNWTELSRIDEQRKALLELDVKTHSDEAATAFTTDSACINLAEALKKLDREIIETVVQARDGLANENRVLRDQVKAKAMYQQASIMRTNSNR